MTTGALRRAEIIAVGTELLGADRLDTNSLFITQALDDLGIEVVAKAVVGDRLDDLVGVVADAVRRADVVILTGGLGPTDDDLTREAVAKVVDRQLVEDVRTVERLRGRFARREMTMPEINRRQAMVIEGATLLDNPEGTAPGQWLDCDGRLMVLLPGPPREMRPMFERVAREIIAPRTAGERVSHRTLRLAGRTESHAEEMLQPLYRVWVARQPPIDATILAASGMLELMLRARSPEQAVADAALADAAREVEALFGADVVSSRGAPLEFVVGDLLRAHGLRLAIAESCTGGLVASRLTDVPGSSDYVERGVVAYSNRAKTEWLDVSEALLAAHGAVSEPVAAAMAEGVRRAAAVDIGVGVTGIAGPGGGSELKPVGTVAIAVDGPRDARFVRTFQFPGSRVMIKTFASTMAIDRVRRAVLHAIGHDGVS
jgi:nicotinamide-nucleotide amidase